MPLGGLLEAQVGPAESDAQIGPPRTVANQTVGLIMRRTENADFGAAHHTTYPVGL